MSENLSLVPTEALLSELLARHDHCCFVGMQVLVEAPDVEGGTYGMSRRWKGNSHTCVGMMFDTALAVLARLYSNEITDTGDEPPDEAQIP